jgi:hypothetical protein
VTVVVLTMMTTTTHKEQLADLNALIDSGSRLGRATNVMSWVTFIGEISAVILAFRAAQTAGAPTWVLLLAVAARFLLPAIQSGGVRGLVGRFLDRLVWIFAIFVPVWMGDWLWALLGLLVLGVRFTAAGLGRYWLALAVRDARVQSEMGQS